MSATKPNNYSTKDIVRSLEFMFLVLGWGMTTLMFFKLEVGRSTGIYDFDDGFLWSKAFGVIGFFLTIAVFKHPEYLFLFRCLPATVNDRNFLLMFLIMLPRYMLLHLSLSLLTISAIEYFLWSEFIAAYQNACGSIFLIVVIIILNGLEFLGSVIGGKSSENL